MLRRLSFQSTSNQMSVTGTFFQAKSKDMLYQLMYKNLGDALMLVWEIPSDSMAAGKSGEPIVEP